MENEDSFATRNAAAFFEKFERYECQELLAYSSSHWLLSSDDFKVPTDPPMGLVSHMGPITEFSTMMLMPEEEGIEMLDLREVHQIVKELTYGIYVLNQVPNVALEANYDQSTSCQLPPAYLDTRVGQVLINVDYMMKGLWHGAYFPREKRHKFTERWRGNLDVNSAGKPETKKPLLTEFTSAGMMDISKDPDFEHAYDKLPLEQPGDVEMAEERRFFMSHVDDMAMRMTLLQRTVQQYKNLFVLDPDWSISSIVNLLEDKLDHTGYERLNARLQLHELMIKEHLPNKMEIKKQVYLLKLISFLTPFLVAMRKKMRIPDLNKMLPNMTSEEMKTERELPPLILGSDFRCKNFTFGNHYFHLHGGVQIDIETIDPTEVSEEVQSRYDAIKQECLNFLTRWLDPTAPLQETYPVPSIECDGKRYYTFALEFETYYPQSPQKPKWVHTMCEEIARLKPKRLPIPDNQIHEQFKKFFGYKKAIKYKKKGDKKEKEESGPWEVLNLPNGLKGAAQRGLIAMFATLCRKCPASRLGKQDEVGLSLIHHAAMFNRPQIIAILILQSMDVNVRRNNNILSTGPTPLHLAARCGAVEAASCLVANFANILATDQDGWAPIHHAAYYDNEPIIRLLIRKNDAMLELQTKNDIGSTPLLLAASSGALSAAKCLIDLGAYVLRKDNDKNNVIHLAALRFHTNILEFFIQWNHTDVPVWGVLVGMLKSEDVQKNDASVKCLEVMSTSDSSHWAPILQAGGVPALVALLRLPNEDIQSVAASVLCNISEHDPVRQALTKANAGEILITLLGSPVDEIQSRAAIVLSDLACVEDNQSSIADQGGIPALVNLLDSELEDVLVNAVNAIRVMSSGNPANQTAVAAHGGVEPLVEFLTVPCDVLQAASSAAIAAMADGHHDNQNAFIQEQAVRPIVQLIKGHSITVQVKAAAALESLADHNQHSQQAFLDLEAPKALMRLLKMFSMEVKEQAACALWSLAGQMKTQQKSIAEHVGISQLIEILLRDSEKLQYVGCLGMMALGREDLDSQNKIADQGGIQPLVRLLRSHKTSERVLLTVIKALGTLCTGVAHVNNKVTQRKIAEEHAIQSLVQLMVSAPSEEIQVEVAYALGCVVLANQENQEKLKEEPGFNFNILLDLLQSPLQHIRLKAGFALAIFAFNNTPQQYAIREAGGVRFACFDEFLESSNEYHRSFAAFQIVVLARVIVDSDQVTLTALGVQRLVDVIASDDDNAIIQAASLMSSLAHTRAGITDAMVTVGAIDRLIDRLHSQNDQVRFACAVALGYLSYNRTATRLLLTACRNTPGLYDLLMKNIGKKPKICKDFTEEFRRCKIVGLPCLSLAINGGPPPNPYSSRSGRYRYVDRKSVAPPLHRIPATTPVSVVSSVSLSHCPSCGGTRPSSDTLQNSATDIANPPIPRDAMSSGTYGRPHTSQGVTLKLGRSKTPVAPDNRAVSAPAANHRTRSAAPLQTRKEDTKLPPAILKHRATQNDNSFLKTQLAAWDKK